MVTTITNPNYYYGLDFDTVKTNLKTFISNQGEFLDYNFEDSGISYLMDVLAYTTQYNMFQLNQQANELTLKNAQITDNIRKLASMLNYIPKRKSAPFIKVTILYSGIYDTRVINAFSNWTMGSLNLVNIEQINITKDVSQEIYLYEGSMITEEFISDGSIFQSFEISQTDPSYIDNNFFYVYVDTLTDIDTWTTSTEAWNIAQKINPDIETNSYYIKYFDSMSIKFDSLIINEGVTTNNGIFNVPPDGDKIRAVYLYTSGSTYNGSSGTIISSSLPELSITTETGATLINGTDEEDITEIKEHAPLFYVTQGRAVTEADYKYTIQQWSKYNTLFDCIVWGGEKEYINVDGDLVEYYNIESENDLGKIYISTLNYDKTQIVDDTWTALTTYLEQFKIISLQFTFMRPTFMHIAPTLNIKYQSVVGSSDASLDPTTYADAYLTNLEGYNTSFFISKLNADIQNLIGVIYVTSSYTSYVEVYHEEYKVIRLNNQIVNPTSPDILTLGTDINGYDLISDEDGVITYNSNTVGSINYDTGFIILNRDFNTESGLSVGDTYRLDFEFAVLEQIDFEKEIFLLFDPVEVNYI